jgi:hypothetical protein
MADSGLRRTDYINRVNGTVRGGGMTRADSLVDVESLVLPYQQAGFGGLHLWGVADGLTVAARANRDFTYQLTAVGTRSEAAVIGEIENNSFVVETEKPCVKMSWLVTGVRHDAWAETHRIAVEEEKPAEQSGYYLHPLEHNQSAVRGIVPLTRPDAARGEQR